MDSLLYRQRHSAAHIMAEAVLELFPEAKYAIGPPIDNGFYYDFDLPRPLTPDDLETIDKRMRESIEADKPFVAAAKSKDEARAFFADQPYKLELIDGIPDDEVGICKHGDFTDLCGYPHVESTGKVGAFKLTSVAGAYWRGDEQPADAPAHLRRHVPHRRPSWTSTCTGSKKRSGATTAASAASSSCSSSTRSRPAAPSSCPRVPPSTT